MKKIFKKAVVAMTAAAMVLGSAMTALAADSGKLYAGDPAVEKTGLKDPNGDVNGQEGKKSEQGEYNIITVGSPEADGFPQGLIKFNVVVDTAGTYNISILYACKKSDGNKRACDIIINGKRESLAIDDEDGKGWADYKTTSIEAELKAGANEVWLSTPEGFDDGKKEAKLKAINVDYIEWSLKNAAQPANPDNNGGNDATQPEATTAAASTDKPAQTGDTSAVMLFAVLAVASAAGVVVFKRKAA